MNFNLVYTHRADKDISRLDTLTRKRIAKVLVRYKDDPLKYAEKIADPRLGSYRFKIGDYRIIFDIEGDDIVILKAGHRKDIYRRR